MRPRKEEDIDFEIHFYEKILGRKPDFIEALMALGDLYTKRGRYLDGLKVDQKLALLRPDDATIMYNLACSYSLINNLDEALTSIKRAVDCGYDNFEYLARDGDLDNLRQDSRFKEYLMGIKNKKTKNVQPNL